MCFELFQREIKISRNKFIKNCTNKSIHRQVINKEKTSLTTASTQYEIATNHGVGDVFRVSEDKLVPLAYVYGVSDGLQFAQEMYCTNWT